MLESLFLIAIIIGFLLMIKGIDDERMAYSWVSILAFIFAMAGAMYVEVPNSSTTYMEVAASMVCAALIVINLLHIIALMIESKMSKKYRL